MVHDMPMLIDKSTLAISTIPLDRLSTEVFEYIKQESEAAEKRAVVLSIAIMEEAKAKEAFFARMASFNIFYRDEIAKMWASRL